jgi:hypothetical protein
MLAFFLRFLMALALVFATWNPSGYSFVHWLLADWPNITAPLALAGVVLLIGWILFLHATLDSLGLLGVILAAAFFGTLTWVFFDMGWLSAGNLILNYVVLVLVAAILAVGMSWSIIWRKLSGQVDVEEHGRH